MNRRSFFGLLIAAVWARPIEAARQDLFWRRQLRKVQAIVDRWITGPDRCATRISVSLTRREAKRLADQMRALAKDIPVDVKALNQMGENR